MTKLSKISYFITQDEILNVVTHRLVACKFRKNHYVSSSIHLVS